MRFSRSGQSLTSSIKRYQRFRSFQRIKGIFSSDQSVYRLVRDELKAKLKRPRPRSIRQADGAIKTFKAELAQRLKRLLERTASLRKTYSKVSYWCHDESRFALQTITGRKLTLAGVKPVGNHQWSFKQMRVMVQKVVIYDLKHKVQSFFFLTYVLVQLLLKGQVALEALVYIDFIQTSLRTNRTSVATHGRRQHLPRRSILQVGLIKCL